MTKYIANIEFENQSIAINYIIILKNDLNYLSNAISNYVEGFTCDNMYLCSGGVVLECYGIGKVTISNIKKISYLSYIFLKRMGIKDYST